MKKKASPEPPAPIARRTRSAGAAAHRRAPDHTAAKSAGADSSLARMLGTLDLFTRDEPVLTVERIALGATVPVSTAYRYVQHLVKAGLLVRWKRGYTLGPRIMQLDLQIKESDPLIAAATGPMRDLCAITGLDALLTEMYGTSIMTIHIESAGNVRALTYGRGRPLPLFAGSSSKAITAYLPTARLRKLFDAHVGDAAGRRHPDWPAFADAMAQIRRQGFCISKGELNNGIEGISSPIFDDERQVLGSLTLIGDLPKVALLREEALVELVVRAAASISQGLK